MQSLRIKVVPRSRVPGLTEQPDGSWIARVNAPPVDGKANDAVIAMVAEHFGCSKRLVTIRLGETSRQKVVQVDIA